MSITQVSNRDTPLSSLLLSIPPKRRAAVLQAAVSFRPQPTFDEEFEIGPVRAAFAEHWEEECGGPVPVAELRRVLDAPVPVATVLQFLQLKLARDEGEVHVYLGELFRHLKDRMRQERTSPQQSLFPNTESQLESCEQALSADGGTKE